MPSPYSESEFRQLMEPWDAPERHSADERLRTNFSRPALQQFSESEAAILRAALERLIPQAEGVDLVGFLDWAVGKPLGRGDRQAGLPPEPELFKLGLDALERTAVSLHGAGFAALGADAKDEVLKSIQEDRAPREIWSAVPGSAFLSRLLLKALHGYLAHPRTWMRIGFPGAAYPEGYAWLGRAQTKSRHERQPGWDRL